MFSKPVVKYPLLFIPYLLVFSFSAAAQDLTQRVTLKISSEPISEVLKEISRLTTIDFSYNPLEVHADKRIAVHARNRPVASVLDEVLTGNGIDYFAVEGHLVLKQHAAGSPGQKTALPAPHRRYTVSGYLRDKNTGEVLIGANVYE